MTELLNKVLVLLTFCLGGLVMMLSTASPPGGAHAANATERRPVLVELFTSEGCSSCPPADALLDDLRRDQDIPGVEVIVLGFHVDYWNNLGWKDPFSSEANSARQVAYNEALGRSGVFTPQAILDGRVSVVASGEAGIRETALRQRGKPQARVVLSATGKERLQVKATVSGVPAIANGDAAEVWVALTEVGLSTRVLRGENEGLTLRHAPVVRRLQKLGTWSGKEAVFSGALDVEPGWRREGLSAVAFVQERQSRHVLGAAAVKPAAAPSSDVSAR